MIRRLLNHRLRAARADDGFTLIEVLIAAFVLMIGVLGLIGALSSARKLTLLSERRTAMAHRAQLEIERLQGFSYNVLTMASAPAKATSPTNPDHYVSEGATPTYQFGEAETETESLVLASKKEGKELPICSTTTETECAAVSSTPTKWADGKVSGYVYDFITKHTSKYCGESCKKEEEVKRITVVVTATVTGSNHEPIAVKVSTLIS